MGETILTGSNVWVLAADRPRWGEIWAFCDPDSTIDVHRCVGHRRGRARFWGDGNESADTLVDDALLIGRVVAIESPGGARVESSRREQLLRACSIGARRAPRRVWYRSRGFVRTFAASLRRNR
jgi:hypothetical protein